MDTDTVFIKSRLRAARTLRDEFEQLRLFAHLGSRDALDVKVKKTHIGYRQKIEHMMSVVDREIEIMETALTLNQSGRSLDSMPADLDLDAIIRGDALLVESTPEESTPEEKKPLRPPELISEGPAKDEVMAASSAVEIEKQLLADIDDGRHVVFGYEHGKTTTYGRGCRCTYCRTAKSEEGRRYRERQKALRKNRNGAFPA